MKRHFVSMKRGLECSPILTVGRFGFSTSIDSFLVIKIPRSSVHEISSKRYHLC